MPSIPQPRQYPIIGNLLDIDTTGTIQSIMRLAKTHGPLFRLTIVGNSTLFLGSQELVNEVCDESRFSKLVHNALVELRAVLGDGLFTAYNEEPNWAVGHRLLMPAFGPLGLRGMFDKMLEMADQMLVRWERFGDTPIDVADTMTRLTLDTLALCAFDFRFNSFYQEGEHPFVMAMVGALQEAQARDRRPPFISNAMMKTRKRFEGDVSYMHEVADHLLAARREEVEPSTRGDLLDIMLKSVDPVTGERLSDENIRFQLVTFLIAGHETTSGLLSFAVYLLLENPDVLACARESVDAVLGDETPRYEHLSELRYIEQVLMESLRLWPTAPGFAVTPHEPTTLGGIHPVKPGDELLVLLPVLHRDPAVWGDDAESFRPERFEPGMAEKLPPNAWKPFGNGQRACIGRGFAMQEAQLVLAMVLQRFDLEKADSDYTLKICETLTMKPEGFFVRAKRRPKLGHGAAVSSRPVARSAAHPKPAQVSAAITPLLILYGGDAGSCKAFAQRLAIEAAERGYTVSLAALDERVEALPAAGAVIVCTSSYEGQPPHNAKRFVPWLEGLAPGTLDGIGFAIFGCGNRQWARTYQAIPKRVDAGFEQAGARRFRERGEADASGDFFGSFESWRNGLWDELGAFFGIADHSTGDRAAPLVEILSGWREQVLRLPELRRGTVVENRELVDLGAPGARSKRHIEIELPDGMTYKAGDYLAVLPANSPEAVERALRRFALAADDQLAIEQGTGEGLPTDRTVSAGDVFAHYVELVALPSKAMVERLANATICPPEKKMLLALATEEGYADQVLAKRMSLLDLLEAHPAAPLDLASFLGALPAMRPRQYSIASSPLRDPGRCALTVAVVDAPALSGMGRYRGVASTYLAGLAAGARISVAVQPSREGFRLPPPHVPIVMICAGSGIAPFRGFIEERAIVMARGETVAPALLFFGCDAPEIDYLYREELDVWAAAGIVDVRPAFSEIGDPIRFVQDCVWRDRAEIAALARRGARFYLCGDGRFMAPSVRARMVDIVKEICAVSDERAGRFFAGAERSGRYVTDIFA